MKDKTLDYYNKFALDYVEATFGQNMNKLCESFISYLKPKSLICDLGCGSGRDTLYFKRKGFNVVAIDGSKKICEITSKNINQPVICQDFKDFDYTGCFDGVWACASLHHLSKDDFTKVLKKNRCFT